VNRAIPTGQEGNGSGEDGHRSDEHPAADPLIFEMGIER